MRNGLIALWIMLLSSITSVAAQVSVGIGLPGVSIGINLPVYPELVPVPGYPVYYAPQVSSNYFFYDGMYWVYQGDNWYASSWYNGPWGLVVPEAVPLFVLRVPVRYYRRPPAYFHGWRSDAPPRWGEHWGNSWEQRRNGWDMWDRGAVPPPAPLPVYQRQYSGNRYPRVEQQQVLQTQNYRYQPQDAVLRQHYQAQPVQSAPAPSPQARQAVPQERSVATQDQRVSRPPSSVPQNVPPAQRGQPPQTRGGDVQRPATTQVLSQQGAPHSSPQQQPQQAQRQPQAPRAQGPDNGPQGKPPVQAAPGQQQQAQRHTQQLQQGAAQRQEQAPRAQGQDKAPQGKGPAQEPKHGQERGYDKGEQQGGERNK
jgi:hypothetical protein